MTTIGGHCARKLPTVAVSVDDHARFASPHTHTHTCARKKGPRTRTTGVEFSKRACKGFAPLELPRRSNRRISFPAGKRKLRSLMTKSLSDVIHFTGSEFRSPPCLVSFYGRQGRFLVLFVCLLRDAVTRGFHVALSGRLSGSTPIGDAI